MKTLDDVLLAVRRRGLSLRRDGDNLILAGDRRRITPAIVDAVRAMKSQILARMENGRKARENRKIQWVVWVDANGNSRAVTREDVGDLMLAFRYDYDTLTIMSATWPEKVLEEGAMPDEWIQPIVEAEFFLVGRAEAGRSAQSLGREST